MFFSLQNRETLEVQLDKKKIQILTTGGTIEKSYNEKDGSLKNRNSKLRDRLLSRVRLPHTHIELEEVMAMDSLDMTDEHRLEILEKVRTHLPKKCPILVLHGTDSMVETATLFYEKLKGVSVPVVFTGAMRPLGFESSDATQNIVEALVAAQLLTPGVYLSFHNRIHPLPGVQKDKLLGTFVGTP